MAQPAWRGPHDRGGRRRRRSRGVDAAPRRRDPTVRQLRARRDVGAVEPVLLVTSEVPPDRVAPFRALHARTPIVVARFGGTRRHASGGVEDPGVPVLDVPQRAVLRLASSRRFRAVVGGTVGRVALPAAYVGARRAGVPFVLWSALWSQPHVASLPLMLHLYRHADAVAAYGEHVAGYAGRFGARAVRVAPQAVDPDFWGEPASARGGAGFDAVFVGRLEREKGVPVLLDAWEQAGLRAATLTLIGDGPERRDDIPGTVVFRGAQPAETVRGTLGAASALVLPSIPTRAFREPWGLVVNEAMHQGLPVIASDAVGAVAGGLVRHERNGLVVPHGDAGALAQALRRLAGDPGLRATLGANAVRDVAAYTPEAWAAGMLAALEAAGVAV